MKSNPLIVLVAVVALIALTNKPKEPPAKPTPAPEVQPDTGGGTLTFKVNEDKAWQFLAYLVQEGRIIKTDDIVATVDLMHAQQFLGDISRVDQFRPKNEPISPANKATVISVLTKGQGVKVQSSEFNDALHEYDRGDGDGVSALLVGCKCRRNQKRAERAAALASRVAASGWGFQAGTNQYGQRFATIQPPPYAYASRGYRASSQYQTQSPASASGKTPLLKQTESGYVQPESPKAETKS